MRIWSIVLLSVGGILLTGCGQRSSSGGEEEGGSSSTARVPVKTAALRLGDMRVTTEVMGTIDALRREKVYSPIAGRVTSFHILEGNLVQPGQVLAEVQTRESQAAITGAEALLRSAQSTSQHSDAQRMLDLAKSGQTVVIVRARMAGIVATRSIAEGELVTENAEICSIIDPSSLYFKAEVPSRSLPLIHVGQSAHIHLSMIDVAGDVEATIDGVSPTADSASQAVSVRMRLDRVPGNLRHLLKVGMTGTSKVTTDLHRRVLLAPKSALLRDDETDSYSLFSVGTDSIAHSMKVDVVAEEDSIVEVRAAGISPGMSVIIEGNYALPDSTRVQVEAR